MRLVSLRGRCACYKGRGTDAALVSVVVRPHDGLIGGWGKRLDPVILGVLGVALVVTLLVLLSMLRQPALRRIGLRNIGRRKWNTALVILGSMVGTALIAGSLVLNDSTGRFQYTQARETLGEIDEAVLLSSQRLPGDTRPVPFFEASTVSGITPQAIEDQSFELREESVKVDGVLPAVAQETAVELLNGEEVVIASPAVSLVGVEWEDLSSFGSTPPPVASRPAPGPGEVYASESLVDALEVKKGSRLRVRGPTGAGVLTVLDVVPEEGISGYRSQFSGAEGTLLADIGVVRELLGASPTQLNALFISNEGDVVGGVDDSKAVADATQELLQGRQASGQSFQVSQVKKDILEQGGFSIGDIFLMISSFAILSGILLIINIYTMLAEERKSELGVLRAVALKRGGLVRVFVYEGFAYSVFASLLGTAVGLGIAAALVWGINRSFTVFEELFNQSFNIPFYVRPSSLVIAASAGLLITFLTAFGTSLRISGLNIVTAIRDLPEQRALGPSWRRLAGLSFLLVVGALASAYGWGAESGEAMLVGPVLLALGLGPLLSRALPARLVWSVISLSVLAYAYFAKELDPVAVANDENPAMFFVEGIFMVLGAVLFATYNLGVVYWLLRTVMRLVPALAPVLRVAVAYPASKRARTGFTLAMFSLVLYLVTISSIFNSTQSAASERTRNDVLSGYDGYVQPGPTTPIEDFGERVSSNDRLRPAVEQITEIQFGQAELPAYEAAAYRASFGPPVGEAPPGAKLAEYVTFVPDRWLQTTTGELDLRASEYESDREAWEALASDPSLAILTYPYNGNRGLPIVRPKLDPGSTIKLRDPVSGREVEKKVIGRTKEPGGFDFFVIKGVIMSANAKERLPGLQSQSTFLLNLAQGADATIVNRELKKEFAANGAQSFMVDDIVKRGQQFLDTFIRIVQAFLAFGLLVGVAGLAVISARAVHERRRDIGTLRAVGFPTRSVGWQFIVESSFVGLLGIIIGIAVGTLGGYNLYSFTVDDPNARFVFPWVQMLVIGVGVWLATLAFTIVPAYRASRVPPVEALRYSG